MIIAVILKRHITKTIIIIINNNYIRIIIIKYKHDITNHIFLLSMLKTVVLLNIFVKPVIHFVQYVFQDTNFVFDE